MDEPKLRQAHQWPAWMDDLLRFGPLAELEPEWKGSIGHAITRQLDIRAGLIDYPPKCRDCGSLLTLHCTILGCGLPRPSRWQRFRSLRWWRRFQARRVRTLEEASDV